MHATNYFDTLILVSPDGPAAKGLAPPKPGTVAALQYERLLAAPYALTSDELIFGIHADRQGVKEAEREAARALFFSKGQPCLRSSPLVKTYGWGIHHDAGGRIALVGAESLRYRELGENQAVSKVHGMRSQRQGG